MIPRLTTGGRSFAGAMKYYLHDRGSDTRERIAWTHTENMLTSDPDKAWKVMAYTAKHQDRLKMASGQKMTGRKTEKPVLAYSLAWHPEQNPDKDHMLALAQRSLKTLGLEDHEAVIIAHRDTPHKHVHVVVNRIHPITGLVASDSLYRRRLQDLALEYQREHGLTYCPQREENRKKREAVLPANYVEEKIAEAWSVSDDGKSLIAALEERGFVLAQGRKRLVVVDAYGKIQNPVRNIPGIRAKDFNSRLSGLDLSRLPDAEDAANSRRAAHEARKVADTTKAPAMRVEFDRSSREKQVASPTEQKVSPQPTSPPVGADESILKPKKVAEKPAQPESTEPSPDEIEAKAIYLANLQSRHIRERGELSDLHHRRIMAEREKLRKFYQLDNQEREIADMQKRCANPPWWRRLFGLARRDRRELHLLTLSYQSGQSRFDERIQALEKAKAGAIASLQFRQQREWQREFSLSSAYRLAAYRNEREEWTRTPWGSRTRLDR